MLLQTFGDFEMLVTASRPSNTTMETSPLMTNSRSVLNACNPQARTRPGRVVVTWVWRTGRLPSAQEVLAASVTNPSSWGTGGDGRKASITTSTQYREDCRLYPKAERYVAASRGRGVSNTVPPRSPLPRLDLDLRDLEVDIFLWKVITRS